MKTETKSIIIGRKKSEDEDLKPCFIALFDVNNPQKKNVVPKEIIEYDAVHKVVLNFKEVNYLLPGNDIVVNNLINIEVKKEGPHVYVAGEQE